MTIHLIKLSVGSTSLESLKKWQAGRKELIHVTRHMPKRAEDVLSGGSIYWVIKGFIVGRQKILELREVKKDGVPHCGIVYDRKMIPVRMTPKRAFQGWRYLDPKDAPPDRKAGDNTDEMPEKMRKELAELGLL